MPRPIRTKYTIPPGAEFGAVRANGARKHQGTDYHCPVGTPIYGTGEGGKVVAKGYQPNSDTGAGHYVTITWPGARRTTDMHMEEASPVPIFGNVGSTTVVGNVGLTGNAVNASPPGSHDHHQLTINGVLTDPEMFYGAEPAGGDYLPLKLLEGLDMLGSLVGTVDGKGAGMSGAWFQMAPGVIVCWDASTGKYQAGNINVDTFAARGTGEAIVWSLETVQWEAHGVGAPNGTLERLFVAADVEQKIWRAGDGIPVVTSIDAEALKVLLGPLAEKVDALDAQSDSYQAELRKLFAQGLTGTVTLTPAK